MSRDETKFCRGCGYAERHFFKLYCKHPEVVYFYRDYVNGGDWSPNTLCENVRISPDCPYYEKREYMQPIFPVSQSGFYQPDKGTPLPTNPPRRHGFIKPKETPMHNAPPKKAKSRTL